MLNPVPIPYRADQHFQQGTRMQFFLKTGFDLRTSIVKLAYMLITDIQLDCSAKPQHFQATFILKHTTKKWPVHFVAQVDIKPYNLFLIKFPY